MNTFIVRLMTQLLVAHLLIAFVFSPYAALGAVYSKGGRISKLRSASSNSKVPMKIDAIGTTGIASIDDSIARSQGKLTIHQNQPEATIKWNEFSIEKGGHVHFDQQNNASWKVLNRVVGSNPSNIHGKLTADGQIYLLNNNGIVIGPTGQIVAHSFFASSFDFQDLNGAESYSLKRRVNSDDELLSSSDIVNNGVIWAGADGSVLLVAPNVTNNGTIYSRGTNKGTSAKVTIVAGGGDAAKGETVGVFYPEESQADKFIEPAENHLTGDVLNAATGSIIGDGVKINLYGNYIRNQGVISNISAVERAGVVSLTATDKIVLDRGSRIETPTDASDGPVDISVGTSASTVNLIAKNTIDVSGVVRSPSGDVNIRANERIYVGSEGQVDVSGEIASKAGSEMAIEAQLNSFELQDEILQLESEVFGEKIRTNIFEGTSVGNISKNVSNVEQNLDAYERRSSGGTINIEGADNSTPVEEFILLGTLDVSGGGRCYESSYLNATKLIAGNKVFNISLAPNNLLYTGILNSFSKEYSRFGVSETYNGIYAGGANPILRRYSSRFVGSDAGDIKIHARQALISGSLLAKVISGPTQTQLVDFADIIGETLPGGGTIFIGNKSLDESGLNFTEAGLRNDLQEIDYFTDSVVVTKDNDFISAGFKAEDELSASLGGKSMIVDASLSNSGAAEVTLGANKSIVIEQGASITLKPLASFASVSRDFSLMGNLTAPSGSVDIRIRDTIGSLTSSEVAEADYDYRSILKTREVYKNYTDAQFEAVLANLTDEDIQYVKNSYDFQGYLPRILVDSGARLSVAGIKFDNRGNANDVEIGAFKNYLDGGSITLVDDTYFAEFVSKTFDEQRLFGTPIQGVVLMPDSVVDVTGGYILDSSGELAAGDAGNLTINAPTIILGGELRGYSLEGQDGGGISINSKNLSLVTSGNGQPPLPDDYNVNEPLPEEFRNHLNIAEDLFDNIGFTKISLESEFDLHVASGVHLQPSYRKVSLNFGGGIPLESFSDAGVSESSLVTVSKDYVGSTALQLAASEGRFAGKRALGNDKYYSVTVPEGAVLEAAPGGTVTVSSDSGRAVIGGTLLALAGEITVSSVGDATVIEDTAVLSAAGYNKPRLKPIAVGLPTGYDALDAGSIDLIAESFDGTIGGNLYVNGGAVIDISAAKAVYNSVNNSGALESTVEVSNPGSLTLVYDGPELQLAGTILAGASLPNSIGASLTLGTEYENIDFTVDSHFVQNLLENGFDDLTLQSLGGDIILDSSDEVFILSAGRKITFDTRAIQASGKDVELYAPWIVFRASESPVYSPIGNTKYFTTIVGGNNSFFAKADTNIDVSGSIAISGFNDVTLSAVDDIALSDVNYLFYLSQYAIYYRGRLEVPNDLTLQASRIYITPEAQFIIDVGNKLTTLLPASKQKLGPLYSAGGQLAINAVDFEHRGYIAAPVGTIDINVADRVYVAPGSTLSVAGQASATYGFLSELGDYWAVWNRHEGGVSTEVTAVPDSHLVINGEEIIASEGSVMNADGGGAVAAYRFLPGVSGTVDPLTKEGRYAIIPGTSAPGRSVYLEGVEGLPDGTYSIVPLDQAYYLPDEAYIVEDLGVSDIDSSLKKLQTPEGYPIVFGHWGYRGTDKRQPATNAFVVRKVGEVLTSEGSYAEMSLVAGSGGDISLGADTVVFAGSVKSTPLPGFDSKTLTLGGVNIDVSRGASNLSLENFSFDSSIPAALVNKTTVSDGAITNIRAVLGAGETDTIVFKEYADTTPVSLDLNARQSITFESGVKVRTLDEDSPLSISAPSITLEENVGVQAANELHLSLPGSNVNLQVGGTSAFSGKSLTVSADNIVLADAGESTSTTAVYLFDDLSWFSGFDNTALRAGNELTFKGSDIQVTVPGVLVLAASSFSSDGGNATLHAGKAKLQGVTDYTYDPEGSFSPNPGAGSLAIDAGEGIVVGPGEVILDGFDEVTLSTSGDLAFEGEGVLAVDGDLTLKQAKIFAQSVYNSDDDHYTEAKYRVFTNNDLFVTGGTGSSSTSPMPGGILQFDGDNITVNSMVDLDSGRLLMAADNNLIVGPSARLYSMGSDYAGAGVMLLEAKNGLLDVQAGAVLDVSAGKVGDAGALALKAPASPGGGVDRGVILNGTILGSANSSGESGSFYVDSGRPLALDALAGKLIAGEFSESVDIRARTGSLVLSAGEKLGAQNISLAADAGSVGIYGTIDTNGSKGGGIEIFGGTGVLLASSSELLAKSNSGEEGGSVLVKAISGELKFEQGARINVSTDGTRKGLVHFSALRNAGNNDFLMDLKGDVEGAGRQYATGNKVYSGVAAINTTTGSTYYGQADNFITGFAGDPILASMGWVVAPEVEIQSNANMSIADWNLTDWHFGTDDVPVFLTVRTAGDLSVTGDVYDAPTYASGVNGSLGVLRSEDAMESAFITLVAGADTNAADILETVNGTNKSLTIGDYSSTDQVFSETGNIQLASSGGMNLRLPGNSESMATGFMLGGGASDQLTPVYNVGTFAGEIRLEVGGTLDLSASSASGFNRLISDGGAIVSAVGDIEVSAKEILLGLKGVISQGAIITLGYQPDAVGAGDVEAVKAYWKYTDGGDVSIETSGDIVGSRNSGRWSSFHEAEVDGETKWGWAANYTYGEVDDALASQNKGSFSGIGTLGGGDLSVKAGGDVTGQYAALGQVGTEANTFNLYAQGDLDGRFGAAYGLGNLVALGSFGTQALNNAGNVIETLDGNISLKSMGSVRLGGVVSPTLVLGNASAVGSDETPRYVGYTEDASVTLQSVFGDIALTDLDTFYNAGTSGLLSTAVVSSLQLLPGTLNLNAGRDIIIYDDFFISPSSVGNLTMRAGRDISGAEKSLKSDTDVLADVFTMHMVEESVAEFSRQRAIGESLGLEAKKIKEYNFVHAGDSVGSVVSAGNNIDNIRFWMTEKVSYIAGNDISGFAHLGFHPNKDDVTIVKAGGDISLESSFTKSSAVENRFLKNSGIVQQLYGTLIVEAGGSIDLGGSASLVLKNSADNLGGIVGRRPESTDINANLLGDTDVTPDVLVVAGYNGDFGYDDMQAFFADDDRTTVDSLLDYGRAISTANAAKDTERENELKAEFREYALSVLGAPSGKGDLRLLQSGITTTGLEGGDILVIAAGTVDLGRGSVSNTAGVVANSSRPDLGIITKLGGDISVFAEGDINVFESRVLTLYGGDILLASNYGDINAGRGSSTSLSGGDFDDGDTRVPVPPVAGSGLRTFKPTVDPDGDGPLSAPEQGDADIFAFEGVFDASEAGVAARNVTIAARQVLNAQNINVAGASVGVPQASAAASLGALTGTSGLNETEKLAEQAGGADNARKQAEAAAAAAAAVSQMMQWQLDVRFLKFLEVN